METLQRTANRGSISTGYDVDNSLKLEGANDEQLERSPDNGNRRTWTFSTWFKMTDPSTDQAYVLQTFGVNNQATRITIDPGENYRLQVDLCDTGTTLYRTRTNREFRDSSAWYHVVVAVDTTQATDSNRLKIYVNGVQETSFSQIQYPTQNLDTLANVTGYGNEAIATFPWAGATYDGLFRGYIAEHILVDGQQLAPTSFGEFDEDSGIWEPKDPSSLTFGTNGHYLKFDSSGSLGADSSGNSNTYTLYNITSADQSLDSPTNNFCIGNALVNFKPGGQTLTQGAAKFANPASQNWQTITGTFGLSAGKWYWEFETDGSASFVGIADVEDDIVPQNVNGYFLGYGDNDSATTNSLGMYSANGVIYNDNSGATGSSYGSGNRVGIALDMDNEKIYFAVDNNWVNSADPAAGTGGATWNSSWSDTVFPAGSCSQNNSIFFGYGGFSGLGAGNTNLTNTDENGYGAFKYSPPSGFYALCTKNLAEYG